MIVPALDSTTVAPASRANATMRSTARLTCASRHAGRVEWLERVRLLDPVRPARAPRPARGGDDVRPAVRSGTPGDAHGSADVRRGACAQGWTGAEGTPGGPSQRVLRHACPGA
jgi:hypothetical protein